MAEVHAGFQHLLDFRDDNHTFFLFENFSSLDDLDRRRKNSDLLLPAPVAKGRKYGLNAQKEHDN